MKNRLLLGVGVAVAAAVVSGWWLLSEGGRERRLPREIVGRESMASSRRSGPPAVGAGDGRKAPAKSLGGSERASATSDAANEPLTEAERAAAAAEAEVEAFDSLTDRWKEPSETGGTMKDVEAFSAAFRRVPKERQEECVHRALNLIPDENVMLLAGILMDKTVDRKIVETVFNDILNRDEGVKKPILQQIFKDKTHPCWADAAWILDVTGELPKAKVE